MVGGSPAQGLESQKRVGLRYSRAPRQADETPWLDSCLESSALLMATQHPACTLGAGRTPQLPGQGTSREGPAPDLTRRAAPERVPTARTGVPVSEGTQRQGGDGDRM